MFKSDANYHTHTVFCDGSDTAENVILEALKKGFSHLGFSGHMDPGVSMDFGAYDTEIRRLQDKYSNQIEILRGTELDNVITPDAAPGVEYRIGSTHFVPVPDSILWSRAVGIEDIRENGKNGDQIIGVDGSVSALYEGCRKYYGGDFYSLSKAYFRFESMAAERMKPAFIGHFDLISRFNELPAEEGGHFLDETSPEYLAPALDAMEKLIPYHLPFEINLGALNRGRRSVPYPRPELLSALHDMGGEILISSDAHQKELLDGAFPDGIRFAKKAGFDHVNILTRKNTGKPALNTRADGQGISGGTLFWQEEDI